VLFLALFGHTLILNASGYDTYATNLIDRHEYTRYEDRSADSDLPPLYPFFLVAVYTVLGRDAIAVALVQIVFEALIMLLVYWIGKRIAGDKVGLLASALYGFYPYLLFQNLSTNDTSLFILMLTAGIWFAYRVHDTRQWGWAVALGFVFGLGALTKTLIILALPLLALWWWRHLGFRQAFRFGLLAGITFVLVIAPWSIRNSRLHHRFVLTSSNDGSNLYQGNNSCVVDYLSRGWDAQWVNCMKPIPPGLSEIEEADWNRDQAIAYLQSHPEEWPRLFWTKFWVLWSPLIMPYDLPPALTNQVDDAVYQYNTASFQAARVVHVIYFTPLLILGIAGWILAWRDHKLVGPLVAVFVTITIAYLIFHPSTRYRSPADPFLFILSAYAVVWLWNWLSPRVPVLQKVQLLHG
jgi:4-amino-4-deoxy-L-arabinose transferase-like glycosyltransferase